MKIVYVCQARMGSTRLPGKVLEPLPDILGQELVVLDWVWKAAGMSIKNLDEEIVIATSDNEADDAIVEHCKTRNYTCIRGSEEDVIARYMKVANETEAHALVRLTGDCPFLDPDIIAQTVRLFKMTGADYASNIDPASWPDGLDCEVFTVDALKDADLSTFRASDRDCVTTYIRNNKYLFKTVNLRCPLPGLHKERWVVDSPADLDFCREIAKRTVSCARYLTILEILDKEPDLRKINASYTRNERYYEAMATEDLGDRPTFSSQELFERAKEIIPLGAQTFSKSHIQYPKGSPLYVTHGDGALLYDVDGNDYVDLVAGLLPVILGYRDPDVDTAIRNQLDRGISFSLSSPIEEELAEKLVEIIPCAEMVRFGKSGTDVTSAAVRLARAYTNRDSILICGGYHGWNDWSIASTNRNLGVPYTPGVHRISYGDADRVSDLATELEMLKKPLAGIIVEPETDPQYLGNLREIADKSGAVLIFDEVITGFRYALGGAQEYFGVTPDLACFGKAMGNGMPISAVVGQRKIMEKCSPPNNIFYSGTMFGETLSIAAALATIKKIETGDVIDTLTYRGAVLSGFAAGVIDKHGLSEHIKLTGEDFSLRRLWFSSDAIKTLFIQEMIRMGVLIVASHNIMFALGKPEIARIKKAYEHTLGVIKQAIEDGDIEEKIPDPIKSFAAVR